MKDARERDEIERENIFVSILNYQLNQPLQESCGLIYRPLENYLINTKREEAVDADEDKLENHLIMVGIDDSQSN